MALSDVTPAYVNVITNSIYAARTADVVEFPLLRSIVANYMNESVWPSEKFKLGIALLMSHYYAMWGTASGVPGGGATGGVSDSAAGAIQSEGVGNVNRSYGSIAAAGSTSTVSIPTEWFMLTTYGKQWLSLMKSFKACPDVTGTLQPVTVAIQDLTYL